MFTLRVAAKGLLVLAMLCLTPTTFAQGGRVTAERDGPTLLVTVPNTWNGVEFDLPDDPDAVFQILPLGSQFPIVLPNGTTPQTQSDSLPKPPDKTFVVYQGRTKANRGTVYALECDYETGACDIVEESFAVVGEASTPFHYLCLCALAAGFLMLFMPCTLPAIGLKLAAFKGGSETLYAVGVILSFTLLGLGAAFLGTGLSHMTSWWYRAILTIVCYTVGLQFLGWLHMPGFGTTARNPFVLGVLSVALGSSCTVPFILPILVATSVLPPWQTIVLFQLVGVGFVSPFLLPIHWLLPKPGAWMVWLERGCGVAMLAVAVWMFTTLEPTDTTPVSYPTEGPRVVLVTGKHCANCHVVMPRWENPKVKEALAAQGITPVVLDWTNGNKEVTALLTRYMGRPAIPFALVVNEDGKETVLTALYSVLDILEALE